MTILQSLFCFGIGSLFIGAGIKHFTNPAPFVAIVPQFLPAPLMLVYVSGVFEILGGLGLWIPRLRFWAAWGLLALLLAVFPANINMAIHRIPFGDAQLPVWALWVRLPLQFLLMALIFWAAGLSTSFRPPDPGPGPDSAKLAGQSVPEPK